MPAANVATYKIMLTFSFDNLTDLLSKTLKRETFNSLITSVLPVVRSSSCYYRGILFLIAFSALHKNNSKMFCLSFHPAAKGIISQVFVDLNGPTPTN